jgi:ABC-2 type transport system ATP-binding protein
VFVSSHLLSEMALMADHLVVIGRGSLIASGKMTDFISTSHRNAVLVRVDNPDPLIRELRARNVDVVAEPSGRLTVTGMDSDTVGGLAFDLRVRVFELTNRQATLEEAFLDATGASEEFRASMGLGSDGRPGGPPGSPGSPPSGYPAQGYGPPAPQGNGAPQGYGALPGPTPQPGPPPHDYGAAPPAAPARQPDPSLSEGDHR